MIRAFVGATEVAMLFDFLCVTEKHRDFRRSYKSVELRVVDPLYLWAMRSRPL